MVATMHERHLLLADRHIVDAAARIARQRAPTAASAKPGVCTPGFSASRQG
jgi:hypothetical protein